MTEIPLFLEQWITTDGLLGLAKATFLLVVGLLLAKISSRTVWKLVEQRLEEQQAVLARRSTFYLIALVFLAAALHQLGFDLGILLGTAGILSVAVGFASQTSASNLISGLFLIAERPFSIGDVIQVGATTGQVLSIDLLSVKLRTFDNVFVRIPNETLIKSDVRTLTKFPIRRLDLAIGVAYKEEIETVHQLLLEIADRNPLCLDEPKPSFFVLGFGASSVDLQFSPWVKKENFVELKNSIQLEIYRQFKESGIEIPFQQIALNQGSDSSPFAVRIVPDGTEDP